MASFAQTLRSFSSGSISREDLLTSLESILSESRVDAPWLLSILEKEYRNVALPLEVYEEVRQKVIQATDGDMQKKTNNQLVEDLSLEHDDQDASLTQIATSFIQPERDDSNVTTNSDQASGSSQPGGGAELSIKGVGDILNGRFVLEERVGSGGMSTVYRALDRRKLEADDRDPYIAVKILNVEFRSHPDSLVALQREAKKCHKLAHPNIVRAYDFDRDQATVYMTMEYLSGHSLAKILREPGFRGMPCDEAMPIVKGMADALSYAHKNGIVHADFKPANVILTDDGEVKVIDFGISRAFHKQGDNDTEATRFDPGSLGALTPTYASPEMLEHCDPDPRDDVYALACIVYELFTGRHPFGRRQANEARDGGLSLERKTLSRRQWKALKSALEFNREKRTPSIEQFYKDINPECVRYSGLGMAASILLTAMLAATGAFIFQDEITAFVGTEVDTTTGRQDAMLQADARQTSDSINKRAETKEVKKILPIEKTADTQTAVVEEKIDKKIAQNKPPTIEKTVQNVVSKPLLSDDEALQKIRKQINAYQCSALVATVNKGEIEISGYLNEAITGSELKQNLLAGYGNKTIKINVTPLTKSMCDVADIYRPYWINNREKSLGTSILTKNQNGEFVAGEDLVLKLKTPGYSSFVNVDYYSLDGNVVHMLPSQHVRGNQAPASYSATLGDLGQWVVSEPYGKEMIVILTTPTMLFSELRKESETASDYLTALNGKLSAIEDVSLRQQITADFVFISTHSK